MTGRAMGEVGDRVEIIRWAYPPGTSIDDNLTVPPGTQGTITMIDGANQRAVDWDNGRTLSLLADVDEWKVLSEEECGKPTGCFMCGGPTDADGCVADCTGDGSDDRN